MKSGAAGYCPWCNTVIYTSLTEHSRVCQEYGKEWEIKRMIQPLKAPFPWFGGKSRVAHLVWERFGNCPNYSEPFYGSGAVLLGRPHSPGNEIINDKDGYVANAWRAIQADPESVAHHADWPVNEFDLHARHRWLHDQLDFRVRMENDPDFYDQKIAGWWIWGLSCWIGDNFCRPKDQAALPHLTSGKGVARQVPHLTGGKGSGSQSENLLEWFHALSDRLRFTKVCCGDWKRVLTPAATFGQVITAVFLDPPYDTTDHDDVYQDGCRGISTEVRKWALDNGNNPLLRIALCGYEGEHDIPDSWECVAWKATGGYGNQSGNQNAKRERIWFSPYCLKADAGPLFNLAQLD